MGDKTQKACPPGAWWRGSRQARNGSKKGQSVILLRAAKKNGVKELVGFGREECCHSRAFLEGLIAMPAFLKRPEGVLHEHTRVSKAKTLAKA